MDSQRLILFVIFAFSALFLWERWQAEQRPLPAIPAKAGNGTAAPPVPKLAPSQTAPAAAVPGGAPAAATGGRIEIRTDRYIA